MRGLEGKTAIVTGGSSGIGQAIAIRLGEEGMNVGVNYVGRPEGAEATKETPGVWGHPGPADTERFRGAVSARRTRERSARVGGFLQPAFLTNRGC